MGTITATKLRGPFPTGGGEVVETVEVVGATGVANDTVVYNATFPVKGVRGFCVMSAVNKNAVTLKTPAALGTDKAIIDVILDV